MTSTATTTATPTAGPAAGTPAPDPRFPWKVRGTRKPLSLWDRDEVPAALRPAVRAARLERVRPVRAARDLAGRPGAGGLPAAVAAVARRSRGAAPAALLRERAQRPLQPVLDRPGVRRPQPAGRAAVQPVEPVPHHAHVVRWLFCLAVLAVVLGKVTGAPPVRRPVQGAALLKQIAPTLFYVVFLLVHQRRAVRRPSSGSCPAAASTRIFPDDIKTRFTDVWGQDHVLERVKENIVLLEKPEAIEARAATSRAASCCGGRRAPARR